MGFSGGIVLGVARGLALALGIAAAAGCGGDEAPAAEGGAEAEPAAAAATLEPPPGGLEQWIEDVRFGLVPLKKPGARSAMDVQQHAASLYVGRQEIIEAYYGTRGRMNPPAELAEAVMEAERRFHRILVTAGSPDTAASRRVLPALVDSLNLQYDVVLEKARASGVPLTPEGAAQ